MISCRVEEGNEVMKYELQKLQAAQRMRPLIDIGQLVCLTNNSSEPNSSLKNLSRVILIAGLNVVP